MAWPDWTGGTPKLDDMAWPVSLDVRRRWIMPRQFVVLSVAALLSLLVVNAVDSPAATGIAAMALVLGLLAVGLAGDLAALVGVTNRLMASYRRKDGVAVESNDPPLNPVRPRAPGLA